MLLIDKLHQEFTTFVYSEDNIAYSEEDFDIWLEDMHINQRRVYEVTMPSIDRSIIHHGLMAGGVVVNQPLT